MKHQADDLFHTPLDQVQIDFENEGGETYICGNPPYRGSKWQTEHQKVDLKIVFEDRTRNWRSLDYVAGWFMKAADYGAETPKHAAEIRKRVRASDTLGTSSVRETLHFF